MKKIAAIIQARMGSTRLPGKVMKDLMGRPMLEHIIKRVQASGLIDEIVIATTTNKEDEVIIDFAKENDIEYYAGSTEDVLDRYYQAAQKYDVDVIVRITADDPFKDPQVIDEIISSYLDTTEKYDYVSNTIEPTYPIGLDTEVFSFESLKKAWLEAKDQPFREHVTPYIWNNPQIFKIKNIKKNGINLSNMRWTVDTQKDFNFVETVYHKLYVSTEIFSMDDILNLLNEHPNIQKINKNVHQKTWHGDYK